MLGKLLPGFLSGLFNKTPLHEGKPDMTNSEVYARVSKTIYFRALGPAEKAKFKDVLCGQLGTEPKTCTAKEYVRGIEAATSYLCRESGLIFYRGAVEMIVNELADIEIAEQDIDDLSRGFVAIEATPEEYDALMSFRMRQISARERAASAGLANGF